jgi:transposase IS116/IS110/IS902 family protein
LARRDLVPAIWLPDPEIRAERERARFRLHLVRHRTSLKQRVHAVLLAHAKPCPISDLFGGAGRNLLDRLALPDPWTGTVEATLQLVDYLDRQIVDCERDLQRLGVEHRYVPLLVTVPGIGWVLAYTIAAEIRDISRFATPTKLTGYTGALPARLPVRPVRQTRRTRQERAPLPALGADRSDHTRLPPPALPRPLPTHQTTARQTTRCQSRPSRPRLPPRRSDLAHAHPRPTLRSGRCRGPPGRLTAHKEMHHRKRGSHPT